MKNIKVNGLKVNITVKESSCVKMAKNLKDHL